jgi:hypothetical protein
MIKRVMKSMNLASGGDERGSVRIGTSMETTDS